MVETVRTLAAAEKKFDSRDDRIWPAQAIDRLLREERPRLRGVGPILAEKTEGTVHLERVRRDYQLSPEKARKQNVQKGLSTSVKPYVQVLDASQPAL